MLLARSHVTQVVLCGINTHACIRGRLKVCYTEGARLDIS